MPKAVLVHLAPQVIDNILSSIDAPRDLNALSRTCVRMHKLVVPRHLNYRCIWCTLPEALHVWTVLSKNKCLARNVRSLRIMLEQAIYFPRSYGTKRLPVDLKLGPGQLSTATSNNNGEELVTGANP